MRQGQHPKKNRGRGRRQPNPVNRVFESNGPDVKIRGNASHISEKYLALARDAQSSGDPISAENYHQHAEHYLRMIAAANAQQQAQAASCGASQPEQDDRDQHGHGNGHARESGRDNGFARDEDEDGVAEASASGEDAGEKPPAPRRRRSRSRGGSPETAAHETAAHETAAAQTAAPVDAGGGNDVVEDDKATFSASGSDEAVRDAG